MQNIKISAAQIEFYEGGNTIWVHSPQGGTILRIKCTGKICIEQCQNSPISHGDIVVHGDIIVQGNIHICVSNDTE